MPSFSAGDGPWITVRVHPGAPAHHLERLLPGASPGAPYATGLRGALLAAHLLDDLVIPHPPVEAMVRRYLTALAARMTGLDKREDWHARREAALEAGAFDPGTVNDYFDRYAERLLLFEAERPFLQDPRLEKECTTQAWAARLDMTRPSGNNAWWTRRIPVEEPVPAAEAVAWLAAWHGYAAAGLGARRTHGGHSSGSAKAAPYRGFLALFPHVPGSLFTTLLASLPAPEDWPDPGDGADYAPWESPTLPDPLRPAAPQGVVSLLTARTAHAVLLLPDAAGDARQGWMAWGATGDLPEATDPYLIPRSESGPVRAVHGNSAWRELPVLLLPEAPRGKATAYRPTALSAAATLPARIRDRVGVRVVGWQQERQERNQGWWTENLPGLMAYCQEADPQAAQRAQQLANQAAACAGALGKALAGAWHAIYPMRRSTDRQQLLGPATTAYYRAAEPHLWAALRNPDTRPPWNTLARKTFDVFTRTMAYTPRHLASLAKARANLTKESDD